MLSFKLNWWTALTICFLIAMVSNVARSVEDEIKLTIYYVPQVSVCPPDGYKIGCTCPEIEQKKLTI